MEINKIHQGDSLELINQVDDNSLDLIITSPPYMNMVSYGNQVVNYNKDEYVNWLTEFFKRAYSKVKNTGSFILNVNDKIENKTRSIYVFKLIVSIVEKTGWKLYDRYIWYKKQCLPNISQKRFNDRIEYIFHFVKDEKNFKCFMDDVRVPYTDKALERMRYANYGSDTIDENGITTLKEKKVYQPNPLGTKPTTVFRFDTCSQLRGIIKHPAPFNTQLSDFFIKWLTRENDLVLDPFMGSGSTGVSCKNLKRNYLGFEINETYIKDAEVRIINGK